MCQEQCALIARHNLNSNGRASIGGGAGNPHPALHAAHGRGEREAVRILGGGAGRPGREVAQRVMRQDQPFDSGGDERWAERAESDGGPARAS